MQYFKKYLNNGNIAQREDKKKSEALIYVKQWAKSHFGIIFRLNNKVLQVNYTDKSQLMLYTEHQMGVYSDSSSLNDKIFFQLGSNETKNIQLAEKIRQMAELIRIMQSNKMGKSEINLDGHC